MNFSLHVIVTGGVKMAPPRKVAENAEHPEGDPEVKVVIGEDKCEYDTEQ